jgi:hypothetical protein
VCFANGSPYRKPAYRTIACDELTANERLANALELQRHAAGDNAARLTAAKQESARLAVMAARTVKEAAEALTTRFPDLTPAEMNLGWRHMKGAKWVELEKHCSRSTAWKHICRFYEKTGLPRCDRRAGMGKLHRLDETRDAEPDREDD